LALSFSRVLLRPTKKFLAKFRILSTKLRNFTRRRAARRLPRSKNQRSLSLSMELLMVNSLSLKESSLIMLLSSKNRRQNPRSLMIKQMMTTRTMINTKMISSRTTTKEETPCSKRVPAKINKTDTMIDLVETICTIKMKTIRIIRDLKQDLVVTTECLINPLGDIPAINKRWVMIKTKMTMKIMIDPSIISASNLIVKIDKLINTEIVKIQKTTKETDKLTTVFSVEPSTM
jgi:hypothetical protein